MHIIAHLAPAPQAGPALQQNTPRALKLQKAAAAAAWLPLLLALALATSAAAARGPARVPKAFRHWAGCEPPLYCQPSAGGPDMVAAGDGENLLWPAGDDDAVKTAIVMPAPAGVIPAPAGVLPPPSNFTAGGVNASAAGTSKLWGTSGELWDPAGPLMDFR